MRLRSRPAGRVAAALALAAVALFAPGLLAVSSSRTAADFWSGEGKEATLEAVISSMDDEELLGQLFMFAYPGTDPGQDILAWIADRKIGGVKIFGWNADDTAVLARAVGKLQAASQGTRLRVPLFIATDQEGGWIRHVKGKTSVTPGNMAIGASGLPDDAYRSGYYISRELKALGVNMNFAPTVDLLTVEDSAIIGPRSFGDDPVAAGILGAAYYRGSRAAGVICTAKHFPGHGGTGLDSHGTMPVIRADKATIDSRELVPYAILAREGVPAVMSGHLNYPLVSGDSLPASMSPKFLRGILRGELGFRGLVVTDDLAMVGAGGSGGPGADCERAIEAGNDVAMLSGAPGLLDPFWDRLLRRMRAEPAFRDRVRDSARRSVALKLEYLRRPDAVPLRPADESPEAKLPDPDAAAFWLDQACRGATMLKPGILPYKPAPGEKVLLAGPFADFLAAGRRFFPGAAELRFAYLPAGSASAADRAALFARAGAADAVVICVANQAGRELLDSLRGRAKRVIVLSVLNPYYARSAGWVDASVAVYSYSRQSLVAGVAAIAGAIEAGGRLPYGGR